jgi:hypothetical protein
MPIHIVQPTVGPHARYHGGTQTVTEALKNAKLKEIAPKVSPLARLYIKGAVGGGLITFSPSAILDLTNSINRDTQGKLKFDAKHFAIASARSQREFGGVSWILHRDNGNSGDFWCSGNCGNPCSHYHLSLRNCGVDLVGNARLLRRRRISSSKYFGEVNC